MGVKHSIPSSEGFEKIFSDPNFKTSSKNFLVLARNNSVGHSRIGVAVRKKDIKLAVDRNKIKRKIKGSFRSNTLNLPSADYVVLVRRNISKNINAVNEEMSGLWKECVEAVW